MNNLAKILIIGMVLAALVLSGCSKKQEEVQEEVAESIEEVSEPEPSFKGIEVTINEWDILPVKMKTSAGVVKFKVTNEGKIYHEFRVEGGDIMHEIPEGVKAEETRILEVELEAGRYTVSDPIPGRDEKGMVADLVVE